MFIGFIILFLANFERNRFSDTAMSIIWRHIPQWRHISPWRYMSLWRHIPPWRHHDVTYHYDVTKVGSGSGQDTSRSDQGRVRSPSWTFWPVKLGAFDQSNNDHLTDQTMTFWPVKHRPFDHSNTKFLIDQTLTFGPVKHWPFDGSNTDLLTGQTMTFWLVKHWPFYRSKTHLLTSQTLTFWPVRRWPFDQLNLSRTMTKNKTPADHYINCTPPEGRLYKLHNARTRGWFVEPIQRARTCTEHWTNEIDLRYEYRIWLWR